MKHYITKYKTDDGKLNQEYHEEMKPRLLGEQWRERQKKWQEIKRPTSEGNR
ncbi:hypothetical protein [Enterococcus durans]|uniref:hypothetical protein n=1 Tax=Enterococcus durans TaxID=53345 RepID=UPI00178402D5|nr:hypothetical protein [Enterococcus durans]